jgi:WXG100 family type VII secretion target
MSSILVTPEQLHQVSVQLTSGAESINSTLAQLRSQVMSLQGEWKGTANTSFENLWNEWQTSANQLHQALTGISQLTQQASNNYANTEQGIAGSFQT